MKLRYIANACFEVTLAGGARLLTDPWFDGPCQQTWWNFPPVPQALKDEIWASAPDLIYISHLHHDHLHPRTLAPFDRATPVVIGAMNTPNLRNALKALGFANLIEIAFETPTPLAGATAVLFKDFHGNTRGDDTAVDYDLDTSLHLTDADGARLFLGVDNTILPADGARIAREYGSPDVAQLPYASASLYPMAMAAYSDEQKLTAMASIRRRTKANFWATFEAIGAKHAVPAGGEYVLGGPVADQSRFLPQPLEAELADHALGGALAKLYPGDGIDVASGVVSRDQRATHRGFGDADRSAYAMSLAGETPSYAAVSLPDDLAFDWPRALKKCAGNFAARRQAMGLMLPFDVRFEVRRQGQPCLAFTAPLDGAGVSFGPPAGERPSLTYHLDERLLFALVTGLVSWNAMEASALIGLTREPDVYTHDVHRCMVHFTLLA